MKLETVGWYRERESPFVTVPMVSRVLRLMKRLPTFHVQGAKLLEFIYNVRNTKPKVAMITM